MHLLCCVEGAHASSVVTSGRGCVLQVAEIKRNIRALRAETVIFDDELSPGQVRVWLNPDCGPPLLNHADGSFH